MPSEKILEQKKQIVNDLADTLSSSVAGVIVDYKGITVEDDTKLRKDLREAGVKYAVVKNTILKLAAEKAELSDNRYRNQRGGLHCRCPHPLQICKHQQDLHC